MNFEKIAPFLKDPLILIGFFLFIGFIFIRTLVTTRTIPVLQQGQGYSILKIILLYGFIFGLLLVALGFGLKYKEMSEREQKNMVSLLITELDSNIRVISELKKNTESFLSQQIDLSKAIRTTGIVILPVMFPKVNLELDSNINTSTLAQGAFSELVKKRLANDQVAVKKLGEFSKALTKTLKSTTSIRGNLRDENRTRYKIATQIWDNNINVYRKLNIIDITLFQKAYAQMNNIRNDYDIIAGSSIDFADNLNEYFKENNELTWEKLASVLSSERQSYSLIVEYSENLVNTLTDLTQIKDELKHDVEVLL